VVVGVFHCQSPIPSSPLSLSSRNMASSSRDTTSSQGTTTPLTFLFRTKEIRPHPDRRPEDPLGPYFHWEPPHSMEGCQSYPWTAWHSWRPGNVAMRDAADQRIAVYSTTSLFWCADRQLFLHVPYDCTEHEVRTLESSESLQGWERLKFDYYRHRGQTISRPRYQGPANYELGVKAPDRMIPSLIPITYQHQGLQPPADSCGIAGDLATLVGLVAFATPPGGLPAAMTHSFRPGNEPPRWLPPPGPEYRRE
jgi:hypothetical protein